MSWFDIPEGYSCVVRQSDTTLYAYRNGSNVRDTYTVNGLIWEKTGQTTTSSSTASSVCVSTPQIPSTFLTGALVSGTLVALCAFSMIYKTIKRSWL